MSRDGSGLLITLDNAFRDESDAFKLAKIVRAPKPKIYARANGVSLAAASELFSKLIAKGYLVRESRYHDVELSDRGSRYLTKVSSEVRTRMAMILQDPESAFADVAASVQELIKSSRRILRASPIAVYEAVKLEDAGYAKRLPGRKVFLTDEGMQFLRSHNKRGPLPGKGNRETVVILPSRAEQ